VGFVGCCDVIILTRCLIIPVHHKPLLSPNCDQLDVTRNDISLPLQLNIHLKSFGADPRSTRLGTSALELS
jgi:hypothetical protein